jgi:hypothetical protein
MESITVDEVRRALTRQLEKSFAPRRQVGADKVPVSANPMVNLPIAKAIHHE